MRRLAPAAALLLGAGVAPADSAGLLVAPLALTAAPKSACELLAAQQVSAALGAPVRIDTSASGPDPNGGDNCVWTTADGRNVMTRVIRVPNPQFVDYTFKSEVGNAYGSGKSPETLTGVADEARYRTYEGKLQGGVIVARKGGVVYTIEGRTDRGKLVEFAKTLASRL